LWQTSGLEKGRPPAHINGMAKTLLILAPLVLLTGCGFDEAKARATCEKAHPGDQSAVETCVKEAEIANHKGEIQAMRDKANH
jgi:hypothetical protein